MKRFGTWAIAAVAAVVVAGCASTGGKSDADLIAEVIAGWKAGVETQDIDLATANYSENYQDAESSNKAEVVAWLKNIMDQGFMDNAKVNDSDAEIVIDGDEANAGPFDLSSDAGGWTIDLYLQKESGGWKIITLDVY